MAPPLPSSQSAQLSPRLGVTRARATMEALESLIATQRLQPGQPLPTEAELIAMLGVSRSSVREALRQLQALDIVTVQHGRGAFVGSMSLRPFIQAMMLRYSISPDSLEALRQVVSLRKILDRGIARELIAVFRGTHNPELHDLVAQMESKAQAGQRFAAEDIAFHSGLLSRLDNLLVEQMVSAMWEVHTNAASEVHESATDAMVETANAHREILEAVEAGDIDTYLAAVDRHYRPLEELLTRH